MNARQATATAHPNIAFIKYWGNRDSRLRLPLTGSFSMNLAALETCTSVCFDEDLVADCFDLNGVEQGGESLTRVSRFLDQVRALAGQSVYARVSSANTFPSGAGIASSASAFAALALASAKAIGLALPEKDLSRLARLGSGSACRSVPTGFVEWLPGEEDAGSYAVTIAPPEHWDLVDMIVVVDPREKPVGSTAGHSLAQTSPLNSLRVASVPARLESCRQAVLARDFSLLAEVVELDSNWMHAVMRTSNPPLVYWSVDTEVVLWHVHAWRAQGHALCASVDAGPNVHVIALAEEQAWAEERLRALPGVQRVMVSQPGEGARLVEQEVK